MDYFYINIYKYANKYYSCTQISNEENMYIECDDLFSCLTRTYMHFKKICEKQKYYSNTDTIYVNLLNNEMNTYTTISYRDIYNIIF